MRQFLTSITICILACIFTKVYASNMENAYVFADGDSTSILPKNYSYAEGEPKKYIISNISVEGLVQNQEYVILNTINMMKGDTILFPGQSIPMAARRLWDMHAFSNIRVETNPRGDSIDIKFLMEERKRVLSWNWIGANKTQKKDLNQKLHLRRGSELSDYVMNNNIRLIKEYYRDKGQRNAEVTFIVTPDSILKNGVNVTYEVTPGKKVKIGEIVIEGNENLSAKKMIKSMENTKKVSINFFNDTKFHDKDFPSDLVLIEDFMHSKGYRDGVVLEDSLYNISKKRIGIWIKVKEGQKYYYRNVSWIGNSIYNTQVLSNILEVQKGDTYDSEGTGARLGTNGKTKQGQTNVRGMYVDNGYLGYQISAEERVVNGDSVDLDIKMYEGSQFVINDVQFTGNYRTNDHVIRRELETVPGDLYSESLLIRTYQRLASMGQFDSKSFKTPEVIPNRQTETVDLKYSLEEISNDQFELSGGWGSGSFIASVGVNFTNVSMRDVFKKGAWKPYPSGDNQTVGINIQTNGTYYSAISANFVEPWLGGDKPRQFSVSAWFSRQTDSYYNSYYGYSGTYNGWFNVWGGQANLGRRLSWPDPYFQFSIGVNAQVYQMSNWNSFLISDGKCHTVALQLSLSRNSVDDLYQYPTSGSYFSISADLTPPFSRFDGIDYKDPYLSDQDRYRWVEYHKWKLMAQWYFPLTPDRKLILVTRGQYGYLGHYNQYKPSPFEGFIVGGDGLSGYTMYGSENVGLRGYANNSLTPGYGYGVYSRIYSKYTVEMRYPIMHQGSTMVYGLVFGEAGNAFTTIRDFKPFDLKKSAGIGLRLFVPVLGQLGIDWGYGFDPVEGDNSTRSGSQFHFSMGYQF